MTVLSDPEPDDEAPPTAAARARVAASVVAREIADLAADLVPIPPGELTTSGGRRRTPHDDTLVGRAYELTLRAKALLDAMVVYERLPEPKTKWEDIGRAVGNITRQGAEGRFADAVAQFQAALNGSEDIDEGSEPGPTLPPGADDPFAHGRELDVWCKQRRPACDPEHQDTAVTGGMARLNPLLELMDVQARRYALMDKHIRPPAELILPLLERELKLHRQLAQAGHDQPGEVGDDVAIRTTQHHIDELRAALEDDRGDR